MDTVEYRLLSKQTSEQAIDCICKVFLAGEPLSKHMRVSEQEFRPFVSDLVKHSLRSHLSWIAVDSDTGVLVGARIITDLADDFHPTRNFGAKMSVILNFLGAVASPLKRNDELSRGKTAHAHMVAVSESYQGLGIAKKLLHLSSEWAYKNGFTPSVGEVTSAYNQRILKNSTGFKPLHSIDYETYEFQGTNPLKGIKGHEQCILFELDLKSLLHKGVHD
jgi:GNAT superfamily N-acetyltransferase